MIRLGTFTQHIEHQDPESYVIAEQIWRYALMKRTFAIKHARKWK